MSGYYVCPIYNKPTERSPHYPRYTCVESVRRATDKAGRPLEFSNESVSGGYIAWYRDTRLTIVISVTMKSPAGRTRPTWAGLW